MGLKIFLTADVHLGMKFTGYPANLQPGLIKARFDAFRNCVRIANDNKCDIFAVAGDLFDSKYIPHLDVVKAAEIIDGFEGRAAVVLPGNHDFITAASTDVWKIFQQNSGDGVRVLSEKRIYDLSEYGLSVAIYAAPCDAKHSEENRIGWMRDVKKNSSTLFHIGIAHGTLEGTAADIEGNYYPMEQQELRLCGLDSWLLGHVHKPYPEKPGAVDRIFYPGAPEPDGFDCKGEGGAWQLEIDEDKKIKPCFISTGLYRFLHEESVLKNSGDFDRLRKKYIPGDLSKYLVKFKLSGKLSREDYEALPMFIESLKEKLYYFEVSTDSLSENITPADIDSEFSQGSFPHKLLSTLADDESPEILQIAYDLIREARI
jgi:DNA repair exonuclease SbcCD nuclease subunit